MEPAQKLEAEIKQYLTLLTERQKEGVLTVMKTFAEESRAALYSDELKKDLDSRYDDFINGAELVSEAAAKERIKTILHGNTAEKATLSLFRPKHWQNTKKR
jgi:hypothetical protein